MIFVFNFLLKDYNKKGASQIVAGWCGYHPGQAAQVGLHTYHGNQRVAKIWDVPNKKVLIYISTFLFLVSKLFTLFIITLLRA